MQAKLFAAVAVLALAASAQAQCNPGPVFDQTNLNLGQVLGNGAQLSSVNCPGGNCVAPQTGVQPLSAPAGSAAASAVAGGHGAQMQSIDPQLVAGIVAALQAQGLAQAPAQPQALAYKPLRVGSSATSASAAASAGGYDYAPAPPAVVVAPQPVQTLAIPVSLALPQNAATSASASASAGGANISNVGCSGGSCGGRRGIFRRASRSRTRSVAVSNGQRSVSSATSVSR
jgi:hypothetical protein